MQGIEKTLKEAIIHLRRRIIGMVFQGFIVVILMPFFFFNTMDVSAQELPFIAKWHNNHDAAISLRFDDSDESHVKYVIPLLNKYGFKATFMVNPGTERHKRYKDFWEKEATKMGHHLGNHTMHHRGAGTLEEAEYEIGETSKIIRNLYPEQGRLLVFASGGGERWGGEKWEKASEKYKELVKKYHLIDLYDGKHPSIGAHSKTPAPQLCKHAQNAVKEKKHQPFHFHKVGSSNIIDLLIAIKNGRNLTVSYNEFEGFLNCLVAVKDRVWLAPLVQILKYEEEYNKARLKVVKKDKGYIMLKMIVDTDPALYDQKLTLVIPIANSNSINKALQNDSQIQDISTAHKNLLINIKPINSDIHIYFN